MAVDIDRFLASRVQSKMAKGVHDINRMAKQLEKSGHKIVRLVQGEPDFDTPAHIKKAAEEALAKGMTHYSPVEGLEEVRRIVAEKIKRDIGVNYIPEKEVLVTEGGTLGLFIAIMAMINPGDEIILPEITFGPYLNMLSLAEGKPVFIPVERKGENFVIHWEEIPKLATSRTKAVLLNDPQNPLGIVMSRKELELVGEMVIKKDLMVISDEVYEKLTFDDLEHISLASLSEELKERTIIVNSFSKTYAMTGWRVGFNAANPELTRAMSRIYQGSARCAAPFTQMAVKAAIQSSQDCVEEMRQQYDERRKALYNGLKEIEGLIVPYPQGAFYIFADVRAFGMTSWDLTLHILQEGHVVVSPGSYYGPGGEGYIRFSYATPKEEILIGLEGIKKALKEIRKK
ncbi:MAG: pyridoxal phosphate-dependent aminotransferase [Thermodesulfobacteriota bacterium]|nr:pyridoxal phosphate-dependent aminotransferase [Thermodesulfobacteriota bacterium]